MKRVLIITDNKPGHESTPLGIAENLKKYEDIEVIKMSTILRFAPYKFLLRWLLSKKTFLDNISLWHVRLFYDFPKDIDFSGIDLVMSGGGNTAFANSMISRLYKIPNILCTALRGLDHNDFSYIVTNRANDKYPNNLFFDLSPMIAKYDKEKIEEFKNNLSLNNKQVWSILIGGSTKEHPFTDEEIVLLVTKILDKAEKENKTILFSTSRRTGAKLENKLSKLIDKYNIVAYSVFYNIKPEKIMSLYLYNSDIVFITEDSGAMITESINAHRPTISIRKESTAKRDYNYTKYIMSYTIDELDFLDIDKLEFPYYDTTKNEENFNKIYNLIKK